MTTVRVQGPLVRIVLAMLAALALAACGTPSGPAPDRVQDAAPKRPPDLSSVSDAVPRAEPRSRYGNPASYEVFGQTYHVMDSAQGYVERGVASWYGTKFHGRRTSSGEPYDMYAMTAAHTRLPLPTYVRVTNLSNRRSVVVRVNDRGPFLRGRVIDLSYTAAYKLGYVNVGSAQVEVEQILPDEAPLVAGARPVPPLPARGNEGVVAAEAPALAPRALAPLASAAPAAARAAGAAGIAPPIASASGGIFLQLGAFASYANAEGFRDAVQTQAASLAERFEVFTDGERFRLHAGPYDSVAAARSAAERMASLLKLKPLVVVR